MKPPIIITEYESLIAGKKAEGYKTLPERTFSQLEEFILSSRSKDTDALELMSLSAKKGIGKVITAKKLRRHHRHEGWHCHRDSSQDLFGFSR